MKLYKVIIVWLIASASFVSAAGFAETAGDTNGDFSLTLLHSNDGESALLANDYSGSIAQFATVMSRLKEESGDIPTVIVSAGDNYLAGIQYTASRGVYDAEALTAIGYDVAAIGNHEFDMGTEGFARFLEAAEFPFVSSNLDFSEEPDLARFAGRKIFPYLIKEFDGVKVGFIGGTTESIRYISSPGKNIKIHDIKESLENAVAELESEGVHIIVSLSHLQNVGEEKELAGSISGVDVFVAGGGDNLLGNANNEYLVRENRDGQLVADTPEAPYPYETVSPRGEPVVVVATDGSYNYIGRLVVRFNKKGHISAIDPISGPVGVPNTVASEPSLERNIVQPVQKIIDSFRTQTVATTQYGLDGSRSAVRTTESSFGNIIADAFLQISRKHSDSPVHFAATNGGGIRNDVVLPQGSDITHYDILTALPFSNYLTLLKNLNSEEIHDIFEFSVAELPARNGRFLQVSGIHVQYDSSRPSGDRVREIRIGDEIIVKDGEPQMKYRNFTLVTNSFIAAGGDGYGQLGLKAELESLPYSYADALKLYLEEQKVVVAPEDVGTRLVDLN